MAIFASAFNTGATPSATVPAPAPASVGLGDLLMIWMDGQAASMTFSVTAGSSGWTAVTASTGLNFSCQLLYKNADATDVSLSASAGSYTITASVSHSLAGVIVRAPGASFDPTPASSGQAAAGAGTTYSVSGITTTHNGDLLLLFCGSRCPSGNVTMTMPGGWTTAVAESDTTTAANANVGVLLGTQTQATAGAVSSQTVGLSSSVNGGGLMVGITQPAAFNSPTAAQPGLTWLSHFKGGRRGIDELQITLPGNPQLVDTDPAAGVDAGEAIAATLTSPDIGAGADAGEIVNVVAGDTSSGDDESSPGVRTADTGSGVDAGETIGLTSAEVVAGADSGAVTALRQPEQLAAQPGPAWLAHFKPGRKHKPVIVYSPVLASLVQISDADTGTSNEGAGFPVTDSDAANAPAADAQGPLGVQPAGDAGSGVDGGEVLKVVSGDTGSGADAGETIGFTPPTGAVFVQAVATGITPKTGNTIVLTVGAGVITSPGNVLILDCRTFSASHLASVTDSRGNTWQIDSTGFNNGSNVNVASAVMGATSFLRAGDVITVTNQNSNINDGSFAPQAGVMEYSGLAVAGGGAVVRLTSVVHTTASPTTTTMAPAGQAGDLLVAAQAGGATSCTFSLTTADPASGGLWADRSVPGTVGTGTDMATQTAAGTSGYSATWAWAGGGNGTGVIVLYAGAGVAPPTLPGSETGTGTDAGEVVAPADTDSGSGAEAAASVALADTESGAGLDTSKQGPADSDTFAGDDESSGNNKSAADTGSFADTFAIAGPATFWRHDFDTGQLIDIGISYVSDSDVFAGADGGESFPAFDTDGGDAFDLEDAGGGPFQISDGDNGFLHSEGGPFRPNTDADAGSSVDAGESRALVSVDTGVVSDVEVPAEGVDVWPATPQFNGGRFMVVWHEGQPDEVVLVDADRPTGRLFKFAQMVARSDSLSLLSDSDHGTAAEAQTPLATVRVAVLRTDVSVEVPGTVGPPGMFGFEREGS